MREVRIFVSSPGDCDAERKVLNEVVERINRSEGDRTGLWLRLFKWEDDVVPRIGEPPQTVVDAQTPPCDVYLGIMSSRFGGDGTRESGTEVEFRRALQRFGDKGRQWVLFYFNNDAPRPSSAADAMRLARVFEFREELEKLGLVGNYLGVRGNRDGFCERVEEDLRKLLQRSELLGPTVPARSPRPAEAGSLTSTSTQSRLNLILSNKHVRFGATRHPPLSDYRFTDDRLAKFEGYYITLAEEVAARNSLQATFVPIQWHEFTNDVFAIPPADPRAVDLVLSVFETHDRREYATFTCNFHRVDLSAVVQTDSSIQTLGDLHDKRLRWAVAEGEAGWEYAARELHVEAYDTVVVRHPDIGTALNVLSSGGADVAVVDRLTFDRFLAANPLARLRVLDERVWEFKNGIMIPRQDRLFEAWVRDQFCAARKQPELVELERQMLFDCGTAVRKYS